MKKDIEFVVLNEISYPNMVKEIVEYSTISSIEEVMSSTKWFDMLCVNDDGEKEWFVVSVIETMKTSYIVMIDNKKMIDHENRVSLPMLSENLLENVVIERVVEQPPSSNEVIFVDLYEIGGTGITPTVILIYLDKINKKVLLCKKDLFNTTDIPIGLAAKVDPRFICPI